MIRSIILSMRIRHWVKNLFVFIPLLVSGSFLNFHLVIQSFIAFISFSFLSSSVYLFNDIIDIENDKLHYVKKNRPIASGKISIPVGYFLIFILLFLIIFLQSLLTENIYEILFMYLFVNINYSLWLKNISIIDVICISSGFVFRVLAGVISTGLETSSWLILMTFTISMLLALGKRKFELKKNKTNKTRVSLKYYTLKSIESMQNIFVTCSLIFYLLYVNLNDYFPGDKNFLLFSSIFVVAGLLRYIQISSEESNFEEPTEILYNDKFITISVFLWALIILLSFIF